MLLLQFLEKWLTDRALIDPAKISVYADQGELVAGCCADDPEYASHYTVNVLIKELNCTPRNLELLNVALLRFAQQFQQCSHPRWFAGLLVNAVADVRFELDIRVLHTFVESNPGDPAALLQLGDTLWKPTSLSVLTELESLDIGLGLLPMLNALARDTHDS